MDKELYRYRHLIKNVFTIIKHFRAIATRYDKLVRNYSSTGICNYMATHMDQVNDEYKMSTRPS